MDIRRSREKKKMLSEKRCRLFWARRLCRISSCRRRFSLLSGYAVAVTQLCGNTSQSARPTRSRRPVRPIWTTTGRQAGKTLLIDLRLTSVRLRRCQIEEKNVVALVSSSCKHFRNTRAYTSTFFGLPAARRGIMQRARKDQLASRNRSEINRPWNVTLFSLSSSYGDIVPKTW